jgi:hypothetical protein
LHLLPLLSHISHHLLPLLSHITFFLCFFVSFSFALLHHLVPLLSCTSFVLCALASPSSFALLHLLPAPLPAASGNFGSDTQNYTVLKSRSPVTMFY